MRSLANNSKAILLLCSSVISPYNVYNVPVATRTLLPRMPKASSALRPILSVTPAHIECQSQRKDFVLFVQSSNFQNGSSRMGSQKISRHCFLISEYQYHHHRTIENLCAVHSLVLPNNLGFFNAFLIGFGWDDKFGFNTENQDSFPQMERHAIERFC